MRSLQKILSTPLFKTLNDVLNIYNITIAYPFNIDVDDVPFEDLSFKHIGGDPVKYLEGDNTPYHHHVPNSY